MTIQQPLPEPHLPDPETSRAVLIGASDYRSLPSLPAVRHNLIDLKAALTSAERGVFGRENCLVFDEPQDMGVLHENLESIASQATDTFLLYFAGHGLPTLGSKGLHLAFYHAKQSRPKYGSLSLDDVWEIFNASPALRKVLILDCCFSSRGLIVNDLSSLHDLDVAGRFTLASAPATEVAYAPAGMRNTQFTSELLDILRYGIPHGPSHMTVRDVVSHLTGMMRQKGLTIPRSSSLGTPEGLVIARNPLCGGAYLTAGEDNAGVVSRTEFQEFSLHCESLPATLVFALYQRIMGDYGPELDPTRETTFSVISRLNQLAHEAHEIPRLLTFAIMAAQETHDAATSTAIGAWIDQVAVRLDLLRIVRVMREKVALEADREPLNYYLVVRIERDLLVRRTKRYRAVVTMHSGARAGHHQWFDEDRTWTIVELKRELPALISGYLRTEGAVKDRVTIEFVVPRELLHVAFDEWRLPKNDTLGYWYRVVVCDLDREDRDPPSADWVRKWRHLQNQVGPPPEDHMLCWIYPTETRSPTAFRLALLEDHKWICIALEAPPDPHHRKLMGIGFDLGSPAAIWPRESAAAKPEAVRDVLRGTALAMLPDRVRELRRAATGVGSEHVGRGLTLLWDDPTRAQPPKFPLVAPSQGGPPTCPSG